MRLIKLFIVISCFLIGIAIGMALGDCPSPGTLLSVENTSCQLLFSSNATVQLWCPTASGFYSMTLLTYSCSNDTMTFSDGFRPIAKCFYNAANEWACYEPGPRIATLREVE